MERNIKRSKSLRAWNKYKKLVYLIAAVLVVIVLVIVGIAKAVGGKSDGKDDKKNTENTVETQSSSEEPTSTTAPTETTTELTTQETTTEEPTTPAPQDIVRQPADEDFSQESFYEDAIFVGDAFVEGIDTYQYLESKQLIYDRNWTTGKASANALSKIESSNAQKVILEIGINDLNTGKSGEKVFDSYKEFVEEIKTKLPNATIYVVSVFPVTSGFEAKETVSVDNDEVAKLNELLKGLEGVTFLDVNKSISDDSGNLMDDISSSGLNIKNTYYGFVLNLIAELAQ